ncbi:hypothetical protein NYA10_29975, partial [Burkholderia thailandensis]|nr:hypothetical protein [Burkholderia thailandensis]
PTLPGLSLANCLIVSLSTSTSTGITSLSTGRSTTNRNVASWCTVTRNLGSKTASALGGGATYNPAAGTISAPAYTTYNANGTTSTVNNVGAAIDNINSQGIKYFHANSTAPDSQALGTNSVAIGPNAVANNAGAVALGSGSVTAPANPTASASICGTTSRSAATTPTRVRPAASP